MSSGAAPTSPPAPASTAPTAEEDEAGAPDAAATLGGQEPVRISIPSIGVDAPVIGLGLQADGATEVPEDPDDVGWLTSTSEPGEQGPAVLAGHVDSLSGPAVFARLSGLRAGAAIVVTRADGSRSRFTVDGQRSYAQDAFPTAEVYGPVPGPALRLITCGGDYDRSAGGYQDNVVIFAT